MMESTTETSTDQDDFQEQVPVGTSTGCAKKHWYLINTKPHQEKVAVQSLELLGVETFCPYLKRSKVMSRGKCRRSDPLFPSYLFSRFDAGTQHRLVDYAHGVRQLVRFGSNPAKVDDGLVASIKKKVSIPQVAPNSAAFKKGETLRIEEGLLGGLDAVFVKNLNGQQRVAVLLTAVNSQVRVSLNRDQVAGL